MEKSKTDRQRGTTPAGLHLSGHPVVSAAHEDGKAPAEQHRVQPAASAAGSPEFLRQRDTAHGDTAEERDNADPAGSWPVPGLARGGRELPGSRATGDAPQACLKHTRLSDVHLQGYQRQERHQVLPAENSWFVSFFRFYNH